MSVNKKFTQSPPSNTTLKDKQLKKAHLLKSAVLGVGLGAGEGSLVDARRACAAAAACLAGPAKVQEKQKKRQYLGKIRLTGRVAPRDTLKKTLYSTK